MSCVRAVTSALSQRGAMRGGTSCLARRSAQQMKGGATSNHGGHRRPLVIQAGKKGFAELLSSMAPEGNSEDFNGRPRLSKGKVTKKQHVPDHIMLPPYAKSGDLPWMDETPQIHDEEGIVKMRAAGKLAAEVLDYAESIIKPGITTDYIDRQVHKMIIDAGAYPSPLNYGGFPKSVCTSLNECICHGIPDSTEVLDGDIINVDVTVYLNGYHGDTSRTIMVGGVTDEVRRLVEATDKCLAAAIDICKPGVPVRKIGATIHAMADELGYGVVEKFVGHGVGTVFHAGPTVCHHRNNNPGDIVLNQTFTIEPMLTIGRTRDKMWKDGWTAVTSDGKWTAQAEHTLLITEDGPEILTASPMKAAAAAAAASSSSSSEAA